MNTVYLSLLWFLKGSKGSTSGRSSNDRLYLSYHALWTIMRILLVLRIRFGLLLAINSRSTGLTLFHKLLQLPFMNQFFYLLLQVSAIFNVMVMILVEAAIFPLVSYIGWGLKWFWPLEVMIVLNLHQNFVNRHYQRSKFYHPWQFIVSSLTSVNAGLTIPPFSFASSSVFPSTFLFFRRALFSYRSQGIFCIHVLLDFQ